MIELVVPGLEGEPEVIEDGARLVLRARGLEAELSRARLEADQDVWIVRW